MNMKGKKAKEPVIDVDEEKDCEDWCFVCKDGGELILCDFEDCVKVYHPECAKKGGSVPETGQQWTCARHSCTKCHKAPKLCCYCCPKAVCGRCISAARFLSVRGNKGLCEECFEYVQCVEEKDEVDSDGGEIDLTDRDTYECLFLEYWEIIKEAEGLTWDDVILSKHSKHSFKSTKSRKSKNDCDLVTYDNDLEITKGCKTTGKRKGSKAIEYDGWGSKKLIEFLKFLGKDTTKELSHYEVNSIICKYIQEKELVDPKKKKKVLCDEWLRSVFRRKSVYKNAIINLLEYHFTANLIDSESEEDENEDEIERSFQEKYEKTTETFKKQKTVGSHTKCKEIEEVPELYESGFASIVAKNIKLVYLRRSLVEELSKETESFEGKIVGSFVKVKNDSRNPSARNFYKLSQVTGIEPSSVTGEKKSEILLRVSCVPIEVCFSMLSDMDFNEEEIEELRKNVEEGFHPKPTIVELEQKAKQLHVDITKHWIVKELERLQKLVDKANEKGWRADLYEYLEKLELLKKPSHQERLLQESPKVVAEMVECKTAPQMFQK